MLLACFGPTGVVKMIWPLWVSVDFQLSPISFKLEQDTFCMQFLPAVLLMTQAAGPVDVFCVQMIVRSVMFYVSLNSRISAKEAAESFTERNSQSFAQKKGTLVMISSCPCTMLKLKSRWFLSMKC